MRARTWLLFSVILNVFLTGAWLHIQFGKSQNIAAIPAALPPLISTPLAKKTNAPAPKSNLWQQVESENYATYIDNLRAIGCPEKTIRDIILADVNQLYARRRAAEVVTNDSQWWLSQPSADASQLAVEKLRNLEQERRSLLSRLLGPDWEKSELLPASARTGIQLAGPVLGDLPEETKQQVYKIAEQAQKNRDAYLKQQRQLGAGLDPIELAKLRRAMRSELARILSPEQLEEFLLRYSQTARDMRREFGNIELAPAEFRAIFRSRDLVEQELALQGDNERAGTRTHVGTLQTQADQVTRQTLGEQRYNVLKLNQDPIFRETESVVENVGAMPELVPALYEINRLVATEQQRIRLDPTLSEPEKNQALAEVQAEREKSFQQLLSPEAFQKWFQLQNQKQ